MDILTGYAGREPLGKRRIVLRFLVSPVEILGGDRVEGIRFVHNELVEAARRVAAAARDRPQRGARLRPRLPLDRLPRHPHPGVPFDEQRCVIPHDQARIEGRTGEYAVGWIKRGPTGIIGTNKRDAQETDTLLADLDADRLACRPTPTATRWRP